MIVCDSLCGDCAEHRRPSFSPDELHAVLEKPEHRVLTELTSESLDQARERGARWLVLLAGDPIKHFGATTKAGKGQRKIPKRFRDSCLEPYSLDNEGVSCFWLRPSTSENELKNFLSPENSEEEKTFFDFEEEGFQILAVSVDGQSAAQFDAKPLATSEYGKRRLRDWLRRLSSVESGDLGGFCGVFALRTFSIPKLPPPIPRIQYGSWSVAWLIDFAFESVRGWFDGANLFAVLLILYVSYMFLSPGPEESNASRPQQERKDHSHLTPGDLFKLISLSGPYRNTLEGPALVAVIIDPVQPSAMCQTVRKCLDDHLFRDKRFVLRVCTDPQKGADNAALVKQCVVILHRRKSRRMVLKFEDSFGKADRGEERGVLHERFARQVLHRCERILDGDFCFFNEFVPNANDISCLVGT